MREGEKERRRSCHFDDFDEVNEDEKEWRSRGVEEYRRRRRRVEEYRRRSRRVE